MPRKIISVFPAINLGRAMSLMEGIENPKLMCDLVLVQALENFPMVFPWKNDDAAMEKIWEALGNGHCDYLVILFKEDG